MRWLGDGNEATAAEVAERYRFSSGAIRLRNVALHALLLALDEGRIVGTGHLEAAVLREYRKARTSWAPSAPARPSSADNCRSTTPASRAAVSTRFQRELRA